MQITIPASHELEEELRNGVILAHMSTQFAPDTVKIRSIYDFDHKVYKEKGLCYRHTDNIVRWLRAMKAVGFPEVGLAEIRYLCSSLTASFRYTIRPSPIVTTAKTCPRSSTAYTHSGLGSRSVCRALADTKQLVPVSQRSCAGHGELAGHCSI